MRSENPRAPMPGWRSPRPKYRAAAQAPSPMPRRLSGTDGGQESWRLQEISDLRFKILRVPVSFPFSLFCFKFQSLSSAYPPAVHRPSVEEQRRRHHAVLLEHLTVLHPELDVAQRVDVVERMAGPGEDVSEEPGLGRPADLFTFA